MKRLLQYLKDYRKECLLGPLFKLLEAGFELFVPLVVAAIIDTAIPTQDGSLAVRMCLVLVGLGLVGFATATTAQYFSAKAACGFAKKLKHALFAHIQSLSHGELDTLGTATLITRMTSDMNQLQTGVNMALRLFLRSPFVVFGAMLMAFTIDLQAALVFAVTIPLLAAVVFAIILGCMPLYKRVQSKLDGVLSRTRENLTGARVLRAFRLEQSQREDFSQASDDLSHSQRLVGRIAALMNPLTYVILNLAVIGLVYVGAVRVDGGYITQGAVFALYNYMLQILVELVKLANLIVTLTKAAACGNRVAAVFDLHNSLPDGAQTDADTASPIAVAFENVTLRYPSAGDASLSDISFTARRGETVGIIGATGSGKSTLVSLIPRFYDVTAGRVTVFGRDVRDYAADALRSRIGIVPQKAVLFQGSIRDNLRWGDPNATDKQLLRALETAQAAEVAASKGGLDGQVEQGGRNFSGGQRQRLTIARALVRDPDILILDDSASALDFATDAALRRAIRELEGERTVFIVSQRASTLRHADKIIVLDDGKAVGIGTHDQLLADCPVYAEIVRSQENRNEGGVQA